MAFFKFRKAGDDTAATAAQPESVEVLRRRARHRLIGAAVLVLVGVIGFPLLFDTQPRPVAVDIPIEIPDRNKAKPLVVPASPVAAPAASGVVNAQQAAVPASAPRVAVTEGLGPKEELVSAAPAKSEPKPEPKPETKAAAAPANTAQGAIKSEAKPEPKAAVKADDGARAQALLEGKPAQATASAPAGDGRYVVQVGAFSDADKARETRLKVERAGLKTYTQVVDTRDGKRTRVRVGPFANKAEADRAADKIKSLDLPAAILTL